MEHRLSRTRGSSPPRWLGALTVASLAFLVALSLAAQEGGLEPVLEFHLDRYPETQPQDLYKLLHQATMGSEHAISDREAARQWLTREIETLQQNPGADRVDETLIEPLSPDGRLVRVNLRPYLRAGGDIDLLLDAFVLTAERFKGDSLNLNHACDQAVNLAREGMLPFSPTVLEARFAELKQQGYPAVHHSKRYADAYRPAYRVVLRELLKEP